MTDSKFQILLVHYLVNVRFFYLLMWANVLMCVDQGLSLLRWLEMEAVVHFYSPPFISISFPSSHRRWLSRALHNPLISSTKINSMENQTNKERERFCFCAWTWQALSSLLWIPSSLSEWRREGV